MYGDRDFVVVAMDSDVDDRPLSPVLERVGDQIRHDLTDSRAIPITVQRAARIDRDGSCRMRGGDLVDDIVHGLPHVHRSANDRNPSAQPAAGEIQ